MARRAVPLGPPTSPSKPGSKGITTNTLNTAPSLWALMIRFNRVSPIRFLTAVRSIDASVIKN